MRYSVFLLVLMTVVSINGQTDNYLVRKAPFSSEKFDEFSPVYFKGGVVFCSNRDQGAFSRHSASGNKGFFRIFFSDTLKNTRWQDSNPLTGGVNSNFNNGPVTFNRRMDTAFFSGNLIAESSNKGTQGTKLGLFFSVLQNGIWSEPREMRFNDVSYNVTTPYLSPDGRRLYFASDKPEGFGGSDLYYSEWKNGYWNNPVNLGKEINTGGNEAFPFVNADGSIFFSSDSLPGKGGKDIFYSVFADSSWTIPVDLGAPINSKQNDFGFIADNLLNRGYFSSDRGGTQDIYQFRTIFPQFLWCPEQKNTAICYNLADDSSIDIDPLSLQFSWDFGDGKKAAGLLVEHCFSSSGKYQVKENIIDKKTGKVVFNKLSYELEIKRSAQTIINSAEFAAPGKPVTLSAGVDIPGFSIESSFWDLGNKKEKGTSITHSFDEAGEVSIKLLTYLKNSSTGEMRQSCVSKKLTIGTGQGKPVQNKSNPKVIKGLEGIDTRDASVRKIYSATDETGRKAVFQVQVMSSEKKISTDDKVFSGLPPQYRVRAMMRPGENSWSYVIAEEATFMAAYPAYSAAAVSVNGVMIRTYVPVGADADLWSLKRIYGTSADTYFVNNGTIISTSGIPALDQLALILRRNPEMHLGIECHTDNSNSEYSNLQLTRKQAEAILEYLAGKGINRTRLSAEGYGASRPVAAIFPESERKKNRRIDFINLYE